MMISAAAPMGASAELQICSGKRLSCE